MSIELRALTADEVADFRQALVDSLRNVVGGSPAAPRFANGMRWYYAGVLRGNPELSPDPEHAPWCGSVGCAIGHLPSIPVFAAEGFAVTKNGDGVLVGVQFRGEYAGVHVLAHFLDMSVQDVDDVFWGGEAGTTPDAIARYVENLTPSAGRPAYIPSW